MVCYPLRLLYKLPFDFSWVLLPKPGAFFGTTFAHLFFQTYRELMPAPFWKQPSSSGSMSPSRSPRSVTGSNSSQQAPFVNPNPHGGQKRAAGKVYVPRIYGFKVSERAKSGPRMQWMRLRPGSPEELDEVDWRGRWIDDEEDQYDDGIDGEAEEDRRMEDFDPVRRVLFTVPCRVLLTS
jgi:casein kinase II subunit beta